jgi:hypothetical protein
LARFDVACAAGSPAQVFSTRKRKDVKVEDIKIQVCLFAFDCLYRNGAMLLQRPLSERREALRASVAEKPGELQFAVTKARACSGASLFWRLSVALCCLAANCLVCGHQGARLFWRLLFWRLPCRSLQAAVRGHQGAPVLAPLRHCLHAEVMAHHHCAPELPPSGIKGGAYAYRVEHTFPCTEHPLIWRILFARPRISRTLATFPA